MRISIPPSIARLGITLGAMFMLHGCGDESQQAAAPAAPASTSVAQADIVFTGPNIVTMDPATKGAEAVAVRGDRILAVGSHDEIMAQAGPSTRVVELRDHALVPGFIDSHGHLSFYARLVDMVNLSSPPVGPAEKIDDVVNLIKAHIADKAIAPGQWVMGYGYDDSLLAENRHPNRDDLDRASTEHPIVIMHVSGHLSAVNSAALAAVGISAETEDPEGGVIRRRTGSREPDGVLEERATYSATFGGMRALTEGRLPELIARAIDAYAGYGITTIQDGGLGPEDIATMRAAAAASPFAADVVGYRMMSEKDDEVADTLEAERDYSNGFRIGGAKFVLDGSPQGRTAFLTHAYHEGPAGQGKDYVAYPTYNKDAYERQVAKLIHRGVPILAHANGDAAMDMMIEGVRKADADMDPRPDNRPVIIHAQLMRADQLDAAAELGIVPSFFSAHAFFWGDWHRKSFGEERATNISPMRWATDRGVHFTVHNDSPVVPPHMMRLMWASVNRTTRSGYVLGPEQRLTPYEALYAMTQGGAYQYFEEDSKGSITPGKRADFVVLAANPLTVEPDTIKDIAILETIARGKTIFKTP